jgi:uracil-DNA glycosylase
MTPPDSFDPRLIAEIRACRICREAPLGNPLPHEPQPVFQAHPSARLAIFGQAPGVRVHASGKPFTDPSGVRLRQWLGLDEQTFYDETKVAIVPMGFCFPGLDAKGGDLPPRKECAPQWRARLLAELPLIRTAVLVGSYAQVWHLGENAGAGLTETVNRWRSFAPRSFPTPHPSWRNNAWLKKNSWFEAELLPALRAAVRAALATPHGAA